jgi:hypothetical protein
VKIRVMGTEDECREVAERLVGIVEVLEVGGPYPNRGASQLVRVYIEARIAQPVNVTSATVKVRGQRRALPPGGAK